MAQIQRKVSVVLKQIALAEVQNQMKKHAQKHRSKEQEEKDKANARVKGLLYNTQFMNEYTFHSSPQLQAKIAEDNNIRKFNMTMDMSNTFHKDYIVKQYERLVREEQDKYSGMIEKAKKLRDNDHQRLKPGTLVNEVLFVHSRPYL